MKPSKSTNSIAGQLANQHQNGTSDARGQPQPPVQQHHNSTNGSAAGAPTSPICRCRVTYLGSSVPHITKDGLQGIQEPLRELYPDASSLASGNAGIDSWLSVWSNGILVENIDETGREVKRFFKIEALHYCAAVKHVPQQNGTNNKSTASDPNGDSNVQPNFLPLDSPHARMQNNLNPPIFASILRRTTGVKVLECHAFICKREAAANALVRCCFHAYADTMYAKQIGGVDVDEISNNNHIVKSQTLRRVNNDIRSNGSCAQQPSAMARRSKSIANLNDVNNNNSGSEEYSSNGNFKYFHQNQHDVNYATMRTRGPNDVQSNMNGNNSIANGFQQSMLNMHDSSMLKQQPKFSKSMHHLNQLQDQSSIYMNRPSDFPGAYYDLNQATSYHNLANIHQQQQWNSIDLRLQQQPLMAPPPPPPPLTQTQPFYSPHSGRVPSYPPQNLIDQQQQQQQQTNHGGTMRSIKSVTGNSIASTLLRSKKHAKAMSMAQLNHDKITSFHQPQSNGSTLCRSFMMPPVPAMFLPNMPPIINGSQTMKLPSRPMNSIAGQPMNFETMSQKDFKKLLKKSAKYGIDPSRFSENGLPILPQRSMQPPMHHHHQIPGFIPPPVPPQLINKADTFSSHSMLSMQMRTQSGQDMPDHYMFNLNQSLPMDPASNGQFLDPMSQQQPMAPIKSILVKPNPEFLKSKAGKKWLKQQKEFKKLLPPHLDGLPIVFGPPPMDALEPANLSPNQTMTNGPPPPTFAPTPYHPGGVPTLDSSGYYNPHPFYGPSGRASEASTMLRYSPHSQTYQASTLNGSQKFELDNQQAQRNQIYSNTMRNAPPSMVRSHQHQHRHHQEMSGDNSSLVYGNTELRVPERQFDVGGNHLNNNNNNNQIKARNHMVEQSVISLGDENDVEDDDEGDDGGANGFYDQVGSVSETHQSSSKRRTRNERDINDHLDGQQDYEQVVPINDDQSSYSSGIYRRGHINERAFSYSIQQEHKSGGGSNSELEYGTENGHPPSDYNNRNSHMSYTNSSNKFSNNNNRRENANEGYSYNRNESQGVTVNELAARVENQLNMKSFANSRIRSNM